MTRFNRHEWLFKLGEKTAREKRAAMTCKNCRAPFSAHDEDSGCPRKPITSNIHATYFEAQ